MSQRERKSRLGRLCYEENGTLIAPPFYGVGRPSALRESKPLRTRPSSARRGVALFKYYRRIDELPDPRPHVLADPPVALSRRQHSWHRVRMCTSVQPMTIACQGLGPFRKRRGDPRLARTVHVPARRPLTPQSRRGSALRVANRQPADGLKGHLPAKSPPLARDRRPRPSCRHQHPPSAAGGRATPG
jgi:hypothetical protein